MKLKPSFYNRADVVQVSKDLLGKYLYTRFNNKLTGLTASLVGTELQLVSSAGRLTKMVDRLNVQF